MPRATKGRARRTAVAAKPSAAADAVWLGVATRLTTAFEALAAAAPRIAASLEARDLGPSTPRARQRLEGIATDLGTARRTLLDALDTLPRDSDYGAVARQLRELATVSPSLMEWLQQVPRLSTPLASAAQGLLEAAATLESARDRLEGAIRELWPED